MRTGIEIKVTPEDRKALEALIASRNTPAKVVWRAEIILVTSDGCGSNEVMRRTGKSKTCVWRWQERSSRALYDTLDRNRNMLRYPVDYTNAPNLIMQNPRMVAINSTTQVDLTGQAASESDGNRHLTGTGGQAQFVRGAYASEDGKSFICLPSTFDKRGERRSRIVFKLTEGNIVTTTRADMMYVVTEHGIVNLKGKSVPERARALISIAHPDFREELERQACENRLIPRGFSWS